MITFELLVVLMMAIIVIQIFSLIITLKTKKNGLQKKVTPQQIEEARQLQKKLQAWKKIYKEIQDVPAIPRRDKTINKS